MINFKNPNEFTDYGKDVFEDIFGNIRDTDERIQKEKELSKKYEELIIHYKELWEDYSKLQNMIKLAETVNEAKANFLSNMGHEARAPLNEIKDIIELLGNIDLNDEQKRYLNRLRAASEGVIDILGDSLDMSLLESGRLEVNYEAFDIKESINRIVNQLVAAEHNKKVKIMYYIEPFTETCVMGDKLKLNQILINLMNNSIKYTQEGHVFLSVKKIGDMGNRVKYQFSIEDTGVGVDESLRDRLFGTRITEESDYSMLKGSGIGLSISKRLVSMMNGEIWYESKKGIGSTFYFTIEFLKNNMVHNNRLIDKSVDDLNETNPSGIILIVEDNEINKKLAEAFLAKRGYKYLTASNGNEAVDFYKKQQVDLILMDIQMPELNGIEATKIIRGLEAHGRKHVPIIAMTAYAMTEDREKCLNAGMDDYISKPIGADILYEKVERYINMQKSKK